ncbi:hypothetical protein [Novipirellula sp.]|uniref:hypothetical protein n=1 Tax=Novipirellula sp. TaxID=2795430 RepID=UPI00356B61F9
MRSVAAAAALTLLIGSAPSSSRLMGQETRNNGNQIDAKSAIASNEHAVDEAAELGVIAGSRPGEGR